MRVAGADESAIVAVGRLDSERRTRVRLLLLSIVGVICLISGALLSTGEQARVTGVTVVVAGLLVLALRALARGIPEWAQLTSVAVVLAGAVLVPALVSGQVLGSAAYVGVLALLVMASAPGRLALGVVGGAAVVLLLLWILTSPQLFGTATGTGASWARILGGAAIAVALTVVGVWTQSTLSAAAAADRDQERRRVEELTERTRQEVAALEARLAVDTERYQQAVRQRDQLAADLREASSVDPGSGLPNQRRWESQLPVMVTDCRERSMLLTVAVVDLDRFSEINNTYGHPVGDIVVRRVAQRMLAWAPAGSLISRIGGEEFAVALTGTDEATSIRLLQLLQAAVAAGGWEDVDADLRPTFSAGVVSVPPDAVGDASSVAREALHRADLAMQRAKREGRNRIIAAPEL